MKGLRALAGCHAALALPSTQRAWLSTVSDLKATSTIMR